MSDPATMFDPTLEEGGDVVSSEASAQLPAMPAPTAPAAPVPPAPVATIAPVAPVAPVAAPEEDIRDVKIGGMIDSQVDDLELPEMARTTKHLLSKEPRMPYVVPFDPGETKGAVKTCIINGYRFDIPKNTMVQLPKSVVELLMQSAGTQIAALNDNQNNLAFADSEKRRALGV